MANFETIKLDKGLYNTTKGFLAELESIDPSENYKGTSLEGLDAFERQLKRFDIKVKGENSDTIDKFFATTDSAALFPEYIARAVRQGVEESSVIDSIIATKTNINGLDYRTIASIPTDAEKELNEVAEGVAIPETVIHTQEKLVTLKKRGRMLVASYEAIRFQKLDLFTVMLRQIGAHIGRSQFNDAIDVLLTDNDGESIQPLTVTTPNTLAYKDLVKLWSDLLPYNMNTLIVGTDTMSQLLTIPELRDAHAGLNFHGTGAMVKPLGANVLTNNEISLSLIGLDKNYALEMVTAGGIQTEYDKLIDRQLERAVISQISGFAKIFDDAVNCMTIS